MSEVKYFVLVDDSGFPWIHRHEAGVPAPDGAIDIDSPPIDGEVWDPELGKYKFDARHHADLTTPVGHREEAHRRKSLEALLILSGVNLTKGILVEEAEALGIDLTDLAREVDANAAVFREAEVARRVAKAGNGVDRRKNK